jgi:hypothetical protein
MITGLGPCRRDRPGPAPQVRILLDRDSNPRRSSGAPISAAQRPMPACQFDSLMMLSGVRDVMLD